VLAVGPNGRYRLLARVAEGGMGEVHRGLDVGWGGVERPVAVKLISEELSKHPDFVQTFVDEARLSYQLSHANIVQVRDIGQSGDKYFIAFEWIEGVDVGTLLRRLASVAHQTMPLRFAVLIAVEAARGLDYAHRFRDAEGRALMLVHRDVSPPNLLISYEGEVKVTDFGIARWRMRQAASLPGALKGKLGYMAPEQARGDDVDLRVDVFSLGCVLYEMLTGVNPFTSGRPENDVIARLRSGTCDPPSTHLHLPPSLEAIVLRAMAPGREERYASCAQLREDLEAFARRESYSLSPSHLGEFLRSLMSPSQPELAATERNATIKVRTPSAPKPFDLALGAQLATLSSREDEGGPMTVQGKRLTVAPPLEPPPAAPPRPSTPPPKSAQQPVAMLPLVEKPPTTDLTAMIPRRTGARTVALGIVAFTLGFVGFLTWRATQSAPAAPPPSVHAEPPAAPAPVVNEKPAASDNPNPNVSDQTRLKHIPHRPQVARLSVSSDVEAKLFVDGKYVRQTPVDGLELEPGRHTLRIEGADRGLFLVPKEETVELKAGESKRLAVELK
jgi:serine/threonine-protein kinase